MAYRAPLTAVALLAFPAGSAAQMPPERECDGYKSTFMKWGCERGVFDEKPLQHTVIEAPKDTAVQGLTEPAPTPMEDVPVEDRALQQYDRGIMTPGGIVVDEDPRYERKVQESETPSP